MFIPAHAVAGLIVGKLTGNYALAVGTAVLIDTDHLYSYIKHGIISNPKQFLKTFKDPEDHWGDQRNIFHTVYFLLLVSVLVFLSFPAFWITFSFSYLSHLFLDALDGSDYFPFYPSKRINIHGPIGYFSRREFVFTLLLFLIYLII